MILVATVYVSRTSSLGITSNASVEKPTISGISSTGILLGQQFSLTGSGFGSTKDRLCFSLANGSETCEGMVNISSWTNTKIIATLNSKPVGWGFTGQISVMVGYATESNRVSVKIVPLVSPTISGIDKTTVAKGQTLTISGEGFGPISDRVCMNYSTTSYYTCEGIFTINQWTKKQIVVTVTNPSGTLGKGSLQIRSGGIAEKVSNYVDLTIQ